MKHDFDPIFSDTFESSSNWNSTMFIIIFTLTDKHHWSFEIYIQHQFLFFSKNMSERSKLILSCIFFASTSFWGLRQFKRDKERKLKHGRRSSNFDASSIPDGKVADRCKKAIAPPMSYIVDFLKALEYPFHADDRPDGYIPFCVAENKLVTEVLAERLTASQAFTDQSVYAYNSFLGIPVMRQSAAYFVAKRFLFPNVPTITPDQALASINPNHIGIGSGAAGILNSLFFLLGDAGDACLIPAPYYAAFENDMSVSSFYFARNSLLTLV